MESALSSLLNTIDNNPLRLRLPNVRLIARCQPFPLIAAFGNFSAFELDRLRNLSVFLVEVLEHCRYVGYHDAEYLSECLAMKLRQRFKHEEISNFYFAPIPRGGHIVLGLLAYALDLRPEQLCHTDILLNERYDQPVVIVDDCAISGVRLQQYLENAGNHQVVFASLLAPKGFREAVMSRETCVIDCFCAESLRDLGVWRYGGGYADWLSQQQSRMGKHGYWTGVASHFSFAWSEPQSKFWNADAQRFEAGWNLMPAHLCLKRRIAVEKLQNDRPDAGAEDTCTLLLECPGPIRPADRVLWTEIDSAVAVARMPEDSGDTAPCFRLEGTAAEMWCYIVKHGTLEGAEAALLERYNVARSSLRHDLVGFVSELEKNKLLTNSYPAR